MNKISEEDVMDNKAAIIGVGQSSFVRTYPGRFASWCLKASVKP